MSLAGRVAAITGASSGIGLACAQQLAEAGCAVVLGARRTDRLEEAVRTMRSRGRRAEWVAVDVTSESDVARLVARAHDSFGRLDMMVCNAGFGYYGTLEETPAETMQRMMDVNFMGTFYGARAALPIFRAQSSGHLIIMSSIVGAARHRADEGVQRHEGGAGRVCRGSARRIHRNRHPRQRRLPGIDRD